MLSLQELHQRSTHRNMPTLQETSYYSQYAALTQTRTEVYSRSQQEMFLSIAKCPRVAAGVCHFHSLDPCCPLLFSAREAPQLLTAHANRNCNDVPLKPHALPSHSSSFHRSRSVRSVHSSLPLLPRSSLPRSTKRTLVPSSSATSMPLPRQSTRPRPHKVSKSPESDA